MCAARIRSSSNGSTGFRKATWLALAGATLAFASAFLEGDLALASFLAGIVSLATGYALRAAVPSAAPASEDRDMGMTLMEWAGMHGPAAARRDVA